MTAFGRYFANSVYLVGTATLGYALVQFARPFVVRRAATAAERKRAKTIVEAYGCSPLAPLALLGDKSYYFSPGGSVVAYVVQGEVALALGDPIGPADDTQMAIEGFRDACASRQRLAAFYQTLPDYLRHYQDAGFETLCIGHEGMVNLATPNPDEEAVKTLSPEVSRLTAAGYQAKVHEPPLSDRLLGELRVVSDEWLTAMYTSEKGFSLGWFEADYLRDKPVVTVHTPEGLVTAFANILTEHRRHQIAIDTLRHRREPERGTINFLLATLLQWARADGYTTFGLGLSSHQSVSEQAHDPTVQQALHYVAGHIDECHSFKGLHSLQHRFRPRWEARYLVYPGLTSLTAVVIALIRAESGGEFRSDYVLEYIARRRNSLNNAGT